MRFSIAVLVLTGMWVAAPSHMLLAAAGAESPATPLADAPLFATPTRVDRVGRIVAPVYINGLGPFRLIVDTGASHSTISPQLARKLGLEPQAGQRILLNGVTGAAEVPVVDLSIIRAGELVMQNARAPVVYSSVMAGAEGILGIAGLQRERIHVDFNRDFIEITRADNGPNLKTGTTRNPRVNLDKFFRVPGRLVAGGLLAVDARIGGVAARAIIDTGAERTLGNLALQEALRRRARQQSVRSTKVYGTTEAVSLGEIEVAPPMVLGEMKVSEVGVVYGDFHIFKVWELDERPAVLLGMDVLGTVGALVIDYRRRELYLQPQP